MKKLFKKIKDVFHSKHVMTNAQQWSMFKESKDFNY